MALSEGRFEDALARADPRVLWAPVTRPALSVYEGHEGIVRFAGDARTVYGPYRLEIKDAAVSIEGQPSEDGEAKVVVRLRVIRETGNGEVPGPPIAAEFTIRDGLVLLMDSRYEV